MTSRIPVLKEMSAIPLLLLSMDTLPAFPSTKDPAPPVLLIELGITKLVCVITVKSPPSKPIVAGPFTPPFIATEPAISTMPSPKDRIVTSPASAVTKEVLIPLRRIIFPSPLD